MRSSKRWSADRSLFGRHSATQRPCWPSRPIESTTHHELARRCSPRSPPTPAHSVRTSCLTQPATGRGVSSSRMARRPSSCWKTSTCARTTSTPARSANPGHLCSTATLLSQKMVSSADGRFVAELASGPTSSRPRSGCTTRRAMNSSPDPSTLPITSTTQPSAPTGHDCTCRVAGTVTSSPSRFQTATRSVTSTASPADPDSTLRRGQPRALPSWRVICSLSDPRPERYVSSIPPHSRMSARSSSRRGNRTCSRHSMVEGAFSVRGRWGGSDGISGHRTQSGRPMRRRSLATM